MQKLSHFPISLSSLKIFTYNSDKLFTVKTETNTSRKGNSQIHFDIVIPLFRPRIFDKQLQPSVCTACGVIVLCCPFPWDLGLNCIRS